MKLPRAQFVALIFLALFGPATAHEVTANGFKISHPWVRALPKGMTVTAGYAKITNTGKEPDKLLGASMEGAEKTELHTTIMEGDVAKMRPLAEGLMIGPGETVELKTSGAHIMFLGVTKPLVEDSYIAGTLVFEKAGKVDIEFAVTAIAGADAGHEHHHH